VINLTVNQENQNRITEIVSLILKEAKQKKSKLGLVADIYAVSMEVDGQIIEVIKRLKQEQIRKEQGKDDKKFKIKNL